MDVCYGSAVNTATELGEGEKVQDMICLLEVKQGVSNFWSSFLPKTESRSDFLKISGFFLIKKHE